MLKKTLKNSTYPVVFFIAVILLWELLSRLELVAQYILPSPTNILISLFTEFNQIAPHILITLYETFLGFSIAIVLSVTIAVVMDSVIAIKKTIYPLLIISQTIPIIILAPLFVIWFGYGYLPKIIIVILICFFPITISLLQGLATVDKELLDLLKSMGASRIQIYKAVKWPSAMPDFFSGLKIAATYSIMGATIGEWVGGRVGLGVYMIRAKQAFATDKVFAAIIIITVLSILLLRMIGAIEKRSMPWLQIEKKTDKENI